MSAAFMQKAKMFLVWGARRWFEDPMPSGHTKDHKIDREQFEELLDRYYELKGWDHEGNLTSERTAEIQEITKMAQPLPD